MEIISELNDLGKKLYLRFIDNIKKMHEYVNYEVPFEKVKKDFDLFIEAILIDVSLADDKLELMEISFIEELFPKCVILDSKRIDKELLLKEVKDLLNQVPEFVKLSVCADKKADSELVVNNPTYSQITYDFLRRLPNYIKFVDGFVDVKEDKALKSSLQSIIKYYKSKYVTYAPRRKE